MKPNFLDRLIAPIAPGWALTRARARHAVQNFYEAAKPSRLHKSRNDKSDGNAQVEKAAPALRASARYFDANYDIAKGVLNTLVNKTIGTGIRPSPQVMLRDGTPATEINAALAKLHRNWIKLPEVTQTLGYYQAQRLVARTWFRDGEAFAQLVSGNVVKLNHGTTVPFSFEMLEPDFVPNDYTVADGSVTQGVQTNTWGAATGFYVYKTHPGSNQMAAFAADLKVIPANRMVHLRLVERMHQVRGVSIFASVLNRYDDIKEIDESERVAARVAAAMAAYIKKGTPDLYEAPASGSADRTMQFAPGMVFDNLQPGEEIGTINSNRPNNALIPFRQDQLRAVAAGTSTGASTISKNYNGTYSAQRQELVEGQVAYDALTDLFVDAFAQPVWESFIDAAIAARLIKLTPDVDRDTIYDATHSRPPMPWINPIDEVKANALMEDRGYISRSAIIRQRGADPDHVNQEILRDQDEEERLGLALNRGGVTPTAADASPPNPDDQSAPPAQE